jgi:ACS family tartrate transporter-like MFS transporter
MTADANVPIDLLHTQAVLTPPNPDVLKRARLKAFLYLMPLLFVCYVVAYIDRSNVSLAKLPMSKDLPWLTDAVFGTGAGIFFIGYFLLEIPGTLIVERWSARKWICRIMISWGIVAAITAFVKTEMQFYSIRFLLGLAEAGFFPGVIVYLTHWFTPRDRAKALAYFFVGSPIAGIITPILCQSLFQIGSDITDPVTGVITHVPEWHGFEGWQLVFIVMGLPAVLLGIIVYFFLPDKPRHARWLTPEEREAMETELLIQARLHGPEKHHSVLQALIHPKVIMLAFVYFLATTANYGIELFLPTINAAWYNLKVDKVIWLVVLPHAVSLLAQLFLSWNSDRTQERRYHTCIPIAIGAIALACCPFTRGNVTLTVICFMLAISGTKGYLPVFWSLPSMFLTASAAAGSVGFINSFGNLGGYFGPVILGQLSKLFETANKSKAPAELAQSNLGQYDTGLWILAGMMMCSAILVFFMPMTKRKVFTESPPEVLATEVTQ